MKNKNILRNISNNQKEEKSLKKNLLKNQEELDSNSIESIVNEYSDKLNFKNPKLVVILAAGHGKRIKSSIPKVIHKIWGVPAIIRLVEVVRSALNTNNQIIIVGNQAEKVIKALGKKKNRVFVYQKKQLGTGHAIQQIFSVIPKHYLGDLIIFPGDLGLLNVKTIKKFYNSYIKTNNKMFLLTSIYSGSPVENNYGRIIRGKSYPHQKKIIDLIQHKDIISLPHNMKITKAGDEFSKEELINIKEFDSGIFIFNFPLLQKNIFSLKPNNIQKEYYITDLVKIYYEKNILFDSYSIQEMETLIGFNDKTILKKVEKTFKFYFYNKLKNIINIEDENNFFISEKVINHLIKKDKLSWPLDIDIRRGVSIGSGVKLNNKIKLGKNVKLEGNVIIHDNVEIGDNVLISTFPNQKVVIKSGCIFLGNNVIKGQVQVNESCVIHEGVNITGSNDHPTILGEEVSIYGSCYIYGCLIENEVEIESSILIKKKVKCIKLQNDRTQPIKFIIPSPVGIEALSDLN